MEAHDHMKREANVLQKGQNVQLAHILPCSEALPRIDTL